ncbi:hypothetical protein AA106555_1203 [Neokomagataea thailandica NBRC 106555]|uniref:DUF4412 domain-containing protein n=2 Tax=Neokomagataea TaxID=1223423 RepID=A0A4Y6V770_9PROT|nr:MULTISPECIES: hypothetical protein [Neokomagataea]QDH24337.1 hypothetical protein D5366_02635 [Neokomagataea tanensis]GBR53193.1 hypothetical protein AA106555_1203 [Neokomagataea thailandica NBRC 106555]
MKTFALGLALGLSGVGMCHAAEQSASVQSASPLSAPYVTPGVDADIDYVMNGPKGQKMHQRMRWSAALLRQRVELEGSATVMLTDYRNHKLMVLNTVDHSATVVAAPGDSFTPPGVSAPGEWRQVGPAVIAGQQCIVWESGDNAKQPTDFCYTADGLLLGATQGGRLVVQAHSVTRSPQDTSLFDPPLGYHRQDH